MKTKTKTALGVVKACLALAGETTFRLDRRTGQLSLVMPGARRRTRAVALSRLAQLFLSVADHAEECGVESIELEGLRQFAEMVKEKP